MRLQTDTIGFSHWGKNYTSTRNSAIWPQIGLYNDSRHQITTRHATNTAEICTNAWLMLVKRRRSWANKKNSICWTSCVCCREWINRHTIPAIRIRVGLHTLLSCCSPSFLWHCDCIQANCFNSRKTSTPPLFCVSTQQNAHTRPDQSVAAVGSAKQSPDGTVVHAHNVVKHAGCIGPHLAAVQLNSELTVN